MASSRFQTTSSHLPHDAHNGHLSSDDTSHSSQHRDTPSTSSSQFTSFFPSHSSNSSVDSASATTRYPAYPYAHSQHHFHPYVRPVAPPVSANGYQLFEQQTGMNRPSLVEKHAHPSPTVGPASGAGIRPSTTTVSRTIGEFPSISVPPAPESNTYQNLNPSKLLPAAVCREFTLVENHVATLQHQVQGLIQQTVYLKERSELTEKTLMTRIYELEREVQALKEDSRWHEKEGANITGNSASEASDEDKDIDESIAASKSGPIKALTALIFQLFLGTPKLAQKSDLPAYNDDRENLPAVRSTTVKQVRFNWDQSWKDAHNHEMIMTLVGFATSHGAEYISNVKPLLEIISKRDLEARFVSKYEALQKIWRGTNRRRTRVSEGGLTATTRDNRARGKLEVRIRKRAMLEDDSEWKDTKYDPAFYVQLMSDDEDIKDPVTGAVIPGSYIARPPSYRSSVTNRLLAAIDAIPDLRVSNQFQKRIRGPVKEQPPPLTRTLAGRARRWMVDPEWLGTHTQLDVDGRIADSGVLWGDSMDPEEIEEKAKQAKIDKETRKRSKGTTQSKKKNAGKEKSKSRVKATQSDALTINSEGHHDFDDMYDWHHHSN